MKSNGPRPDAVPVDQGEFEPLRVYLLGDLVHWQEETYRAKADFRSGYLEPPIVIRDTGNVFWEKV